MDSTPADSDVPSIDQPKSGGQGVVDSLEDRVRIRKLQESFGDVCGIDAQHLGVVYRNGNWGVEDVTFSIPQATICALVGINGSGKSTLFKSLMGFVRAATGQVSILGLPVGKSLPANTVAYVPQNEEVDWNFPILVEDVVMMGRFGHMGWLRKARPIDHEHVERALQRVDMLGYRKRQIGELSGGQKKRVFLARALAQGGKVILLDEPFTGVDVNSENSIIELLRELRETGHVILVSTHNLGSVPQFCDQVILLNRTVLDFGETETVFTSSNLQRAFGGTLRFHILAGTDLHDDDDTRQVTVITDDERPVVIYGDDQPPNTVARDDH